MRFGQTNLPYFLNMYLENPTYRCDDGEVWQVAAPGLGVVGQDHVPLLDLAPQHAHLQQPDRLLVLECFMQ